MVVITQNGKRVEAREFHVVDGRASFVSVEGLSMQLPMDQIKSVSMNAADALTAISERDSLKEENKRLLRQIAKTSETLAANAESINGLLSARPVIAAQPLPLEPERHSMPEMAYAIPPEQPQESSQTNEVTVYVTSTGLKYHTAGCQYLAKSSIPLTLSDAIGRELTPCSRCGAMSVSGNVSSLPSQALSSPAPQQSYGGGSPPGTFVGPRGGVYHYSKSGKKVYHKKKR